MTYIALIALAITIHGIWTFMARMAGGFAGFREFFLVGFATFMALDIVAHTWIRPNKPILDTTSEVLVGTLTLATYVLVMVSYRVSVWYAQRSHQPASINVPTIVTWRACSAFLFPLCLFCFVVFAVAGNQLGSVAVLFIATARSIALILLVAGILQRERKLALYGLAMFVGMAVLSDEVSRRAYIGPLLIILLYSLNYSVVSGSLSDKARLTTVFGIVLFVVTLSVALRADYNVAEDATTAQHLQDYIFNITPIDTFANTVTVVEIFPSQVDYLGWVSYMASVMNWIPREIRPWNSYSISSLLGFYFNTGSLSFDHISWQDHSGLSLTSGIIGEAWASFGLAGAIIVPIIMGLIFGRLDLRLVNRLGARPSPLYSLDDLPLLIWLPSVLLLSRGDLYSATYYAVPTSIAVWAIVRMLRVVR